MRSPSRESAYPSPWPGIPMLILGILLVLQFPFGMAWSVPMVDERTDFALGVVLIVTTCILLLGAVFVFRGLVLVNPNQSKVAVLFGRYKGTLRHDGFYWINPFTVRQKVSLRAHNFDSDKLKVNDRRGNPIEIGAVVVWRVKDTAQAAFDVEDYESYIEVQSESALRHLASVHPYDAPADDEISLRGGHEQINEELQKELTERLDMAGIEVLEARIAHLAYAPEIASAMLQRQQAEAIIDARRKIVDGAVGMVQMALEGLQESGVLELDEEKKASMVSNLLVVLCSERGTQPVVNTGTLYG